METLQAKPINKDAELPASRVAIFVRNMEKFRGDASMYMLCPAHEGFEHVVVSSVDAIDVQSSETMIFGVTNGVVDLNDEIVCFRPEKTHKSALFAIGYNLIR